MRICSYLKLSLVLFLCLLVNKVSLANDGVLVVTEPLQFSPQTQRIEAVGTAQALRAVVLYPAVADRVVEIAIIPGQQVERDDVLVRLDSRRQQIAVDRARIQLADAERTVDRLTRSREQQAIPQSELDDAVTARDLLRVELSEAEAKCTSTFAHQKVHWTCSAITRLWSLALGSNKVTRCRLKWLK